MNVKLSTGYGGRAVECHFVHTFSYLVTVASVRASLSDFYATGQETCVILVFIYNTLIFIFKNRINFPSLLKKQCKLTGKSSSGAVCSYSAI